jgi:hypothetical protein
MAYLLVRDQPIGHLDSRTTFRSVSKSIIQRVVMIRLLHQRLPVGLSELQLWQRMFDSFVSFC